MLFVFTGTDISKIAQQSRVLVSGLQKKQPDAQLITLDTISENSLRSLALDQGMFFQKSIIRIEKIFPDKTAEDVIKSNLNEIIASPSIFVWSESGLGKVWIKRLEKSGATVHQFGQVDKSGFDSQAFAAANALVSKDSRKLWLEVVKQMKSDQEVEALYGMLWWQLKVILLAKQYDQSTSGLKPFVYNKAARSSWKIDDTKRALEQLIDVQIRSKIKGQDMWFELQEFALQI